MKAVFCEKYGEPDTLVVRDVESPQAGPGELKIKLHARGVSYTDLLKVAGKYQVKSEPPFIAGSEASGEVIALGAGVDGFSIGDRVLSSGGFAEETVQPVEDVLKLGPNVDFAAAAAFRSNYQTAYYGLQRGRLAPGETLLVHGAAGGVGLAAVDMGKLLGATVIATASTPEKLAVCSTMGADHVINYTDGFRDQVKALTDGRGADVIYDPVGGDVFDESMRCVAPFGRILIVGFTAGRPGLAKTNHLLIKDAEVIGYTIGGLQRHKPEWLQKTMDTLVQWLNSGRIHPYHSHALPLEQAADALKLIEDRKVIGKALLI
ncbi:MAG: NADPH:quinone oxidoreductase family protein [Gammaproteobacteria bacterium]|nr:NADPH:quinone oxidoreductase family protein [Gammaproteobacteria bacterium]